MTPDPRFIRSVQSAFGTFLDDYDWTYFVTLTYAETVPPVAAVQRDIENYIRRLERSSKKAVTYFVAIEGGEGRGRIHVHALIGNVEQLTPLLLSNAWRHGLAHVRRYRPGRGASFYVSKFAAEDFTEFLLNLPASKKAA